MDLDHIEREKATGGKTGYYLHEGQAEAHATFGVTKELNPYGVKASNIKLYNYRMKLAEEEDRRRKEKER